MKAEGKSVKKILANLPDDRKVPFNKLHETILKNLPKGFEAAISYGGLGYVVPHTIYPDGYHCSPAGNRHYWLLPNLHTSQNRHPQRPSGRAKPERARYRLAREMRRERNSSPGSVERIRREKTPTRPSPLSTHPTSQPIRL